MHRESDISRRLHYFALFWLGVLFFVLPIAHTAAYRTLGILLPLAVLCYYKWSSKTVHWAPTGFEWPFLGFFLMAVASLPTAVDFRESLGEIKGELLVPILLFYVIYLSVRKEQEGILLLRVMFFCSLVFSLFSFYDFYQHGGDWSTAVYRAGGLRDPGGGEVAALFHTIVIPFLFFGLFYFKGTLTRFVVFFLLVINLVGLHITFTRAAYLALAWQALFVAIILAYWKRWRLLVCFFLVMGVIFTTYLENKAFREMQTSKLPSLADLYRFTPEQIAGTEPNSTTWRLGMWKTALIEVAKNPFYPHGYGRFTFGKGVRTPANSHFIFKQTHNSFVGVLFELGIQGFIVFLWMIGMFFYACLKGFKQAKPGSLAEYLALSLMTMMIGYWINNFFGSFDGDDSKLLFMALLGIGMAVMVRLPRHSNEQVTEQHG